MLPAKGLKRSKDNKKSCLFLIRDARRVAELMQIAELLLLRWGAKAKNSGERGNQCDLTGRKFKLIRQPRGASIYKRE